MGNHRFHGHCVQLGSHLADHLNFTAAVYRWKVLMLIYSSPKVTDDLLDSSLDLELV